MTEATGPPLCKKVSFAHFTGFRRRDLTHFSDIDQRACIACRHCILCVVLTGPTGSNIGR